MVLYVDNFGFAVVVVSVRFAETVAAIAARDAVHIRIRRKLGVEKTGAQCIVYLKIYIVRFQKLWRFFRKKTSRFQ